MATHKVPQDVETDDKLIGFLSLKQFIFVVVGLGFGYLTFFFATKVHPLAAIIWVPFTVVPLVLGLYQRKDQPVEVFLASAIRYYLKPRTRKWDQEGYEERVTITAPPKVEHHYTKDFSGDEAMSRLTRLSHMMDSRGWASKLAGDWQNPQLAATAGSDGRLVQPAQIAGSSDYLQAYMQPVDIMDEQTSLVAQDFQAKIYQTDNTARVQAMKTVQAAQSSMSTQTLAADEPLPEHPMVAKYPEMAQSVIQPLADTRPDVAPAPQPTVTPAVVQPVVETTPEPSVEPIATVDDDGSVEISLH